MRWPEAGTAGRLRCLRDMEPDGPANKPMNSEPLRHFVDFLAHRKTPRPAITPGCNGLANAEWDADGRGALATGFLGSGPTLRRPHDMMRRIGQVVDRLRQESADEGA